MNNPSALSAIDSQQNDAALQDMYAMLMTKNESGGGQNMQAYGADAMKFQIRPPHGIDNPIPPPPPIPESRKRPVPQFESQADEEQECEKRRKYAQVAMQDAARSMAEAYRRR